MHFQSALKGHKVSSWGSLDVLTGDISNLSAFLIFQHIGDMLACWSLLITSKPETLKNQLCIVAVKSVLQMCIYHILKACFASDYHVFWCNFF